MSEKSVLDSCTALELADHTLAEELKEQWGKETEQAEEGKAFLHYTSLYVNKVREELNLLENYAIYASEDIGSPPDEILEEYSTVTEWKETSPTVEVLNEPE